MASKNIFGNTSDQEKLLRNKAPWLKVLLTNPTPIKWQEIRSHVELCSEAMKSIKNQIKDETNNAKRLKEIKENAHTMRKWKKISNHIRKSKENPTLK